MLVETLPRGLQVTLKVTRNAHARALAALSGNLWDLFVSYLHGARFGNLWDFVCVIRPWNVMITLVLDLMKTLSSFGHARQNANEDESSPEETMPSICSSLFPFQGFDTRFLPLVEWTWMRFNSFNDLNFSPASRVTHEVLADLFLLMLLVINRLARASIGLNPFLLKDGSFVPRIPRETFVCLLVLELFDLTLKHVHKKNSIRVSVLRDLVHVVDRLSGKLLVGGRFFRLGVRGRRARLCPAPAPSNVRFHRSR